MLNFSKLRTIWKKKKNSEDVKQIHLKFLPTTGITQR